MKTISFDSKASSKDKHTYANSLRRGLKIIGKQLVHFPSTFTEVLICHYKTIQFLHYLSKDVLDSIQKL